MRVFDHQVRTMATVVPPNLLHFARPMRHDPSSAESKPWHCLRDRQLGGYTFRRQRPVPPFVVDFCCVAIGLAIEVDGDSQADQAAYDERRTTHLDRDGAFRCSDSPTATSAGTLNKC